MEFEKIYSEHITALYNFALKLTNNPADAEDLAENTFMRSFRFMHKFKKGTNMKMWLFRIMHNIFINTYRKKKREPMMVELNEEALFKQDISPDFFSKLMDKEVQAALDSLPEEFKKAIILFDLENFSYMEISEILNCPLGTVRSRISRGRSLLFEKLYNYAKSSGYLK